MKDNPAGKWFPNQWVLVDISPIHVGVVIVLISWIMELTVSETKDKLLGGKLQRSNMPLCVFFVCPAGSDHDFFVCPAGSDHDFFV